MKLKPLPVIAAFVSLLVSPVLAQASGVASLRDSSTTSSQQVFLRVVWGGDSGGSGTAGDVFEIYGWSHEVVSPRDAASGLPTGKRQHKPVSVTKPVDKATPLFHGAFVTGRALPSVEVLLVRTDRSGTPAPYFSIRLTNATIADVSTSGAAGAGTPTTEQVALVYEHIEWEHESGGTMASDDWVQN